MKIAGFYEELWNSSFGTPDGSIRDHVTSRMSEDAQSITEYLQSGHVISSVMGSSTDVMGSGKSILGGDSIYTDGEWIWRGDLWFYVWNHHVKLPPELLDRIRNNDYVVPAEDEERSVAITRMVLEKL